MEPAFQKCREITFINCFPHIEYLANAIRNKDITVGMAETELRHARESIVRELEKWAFVPIDPQMAMYFENQAIFGDTVHSAFPEAVADLLASGNCIAVGLDTSAVFHLMRVAEFGLRRIAKKLRVKLTHSGRAHPIEYADWDKVIVAIKNKIAKVRAKPQGAKRQELLERYSDAADHCAFMKDIWRNSVSHTRSAYKRAEAIAALERVRDFMRFLSSGGLL